MRRIALACSFCRRCAWHSGVPWQQETTCRIVYVVSEAVNESERLIDSMPLTLWVDVATGSSVVKVIAIVASKFERFLYPTLSMPIDTKGILARFLASTTYVLATLVVEVMLVHCNACLLVAICSRLLIDSSLACVEPIAKSITRRGGTGQRRICGNSHSAQIAHRATCITCVCPLAPHAYVARVLGTLTQ
jgi:hypothetical protein